MIKVISLLFIFFVNNACCQDISYARQIINVLTSEEFKGRGYSGKGDVKSAEFIRGEFIKLGIKSLGDNYFQHFSLNVNTFQGKMEVKINNFKLTPGVDYLVDPASASLTGKFPVLRISRNECLDKSRRDELRENAVGKAVLFDLTDTVKYSKAQEDSLNQIIQAWQYDPAFRNVVSLILTDKKLSFGISPWQAKKSIITLKSTELTENVFPEIEINIISKYKADYRTQNITGYLPGTCHKDSFIVITAHYDHLGTMGKEVYFPGANDNASGVAMMLGLAKYFSDKPICCNILFIAFSAEEAGLVGSAYFSMNPLIDLSRIKFLLNFDLAGTGDEGIKVVNATKYPKEFNILTSINDRYKYLPGVYPREEACISDHCFFSELGIPSFYIYTLGGISAYHDIYDKAETLPLTEFEDYQRLIISFIETLETKP